MKINGGGTGPVRPGSARDALGPAADKTDQGGGSTTPRMDSVEISDAGRAKAAGTVAGTTATVDARGARLQEIRQRVLRGAYDTDAVVAEVARRILDRGDLHPVPPAETQ